MQPCRASGRCTGLTSNGSKGWSATVASAPRGNSVSTKRALAHRDKTVQPDTAVGAKDADLAARKKRQPLKRAFQRLPDQIQPVRGG